MNASATNNAHAHATHANYVEASAARKLVLVSAVVSVAATEAGVEGVSDYAQVRVRVPVPHVLHDHCVRVHVEVYAHAYVHAYVSA